MSAISLLNEIESMESCFQKKYYLIKISLEYSPSNESLEKNLTVFSKFTSFYMKLRGNFKKKDERIQNFISKFLEYLKEQETFYKNHSQYLSFKLLTLYVGIMKADFGMIKNVHKDILNYMDYHILKNGKFRDAMEHDSLYYQVDNLTELCKIFTTLQKYGFYHFNYLHYRNMVGSTIFKAFMYLGPFIQKKKVHYEYLNSIFNEDRKNPGFGELWDPNSAKSLLENFVYLDKKLEHLNVSK